MKVNVEKLWDVFDCATCLDLFPDKTCDGYGQPDSLIKRNIPQCGKVNFDNGLNHYRYCREIDLDLLKERLIKNGKDLSLIDKIIEYILAGE